MSSAVFDENNRATNSLGNYNVTTLYSYLKIEPKEGLVVTRLLTILPELSPRGRIRCTLECFELNPGVELTLGLRYRALSYVWGEVPATEVIEINGYEFLVRPNLWAFLDRVRQLHSLDEGTRWWIDAICIDQSNLAGRGHQVMSMGQIYNNAYEVVCWLGSLSTLLDTLLKVASDFYRATCQLWPQPCSLRPEDLPALYHAFDELPDDGLVWDTAIARSAWREFSELPNWGRAWVTQEVTLAKELMLLTAVAAISMRAVGAYVQTLESDVFTEAVHSVIGASWLWAYNPLS